MVCTTVPFVETLPKLEAQELIKKTQKKTAICYASHNVRAIRARDVRVADILINEIICRLTKVIEFNDTMNMRL